MDPALPALLADPQWQPYLVFPADADAAGRVVTDTLLAGSALPLGAESVAAHASKRPLFVLLDATWSEARKMFRKSPYLAHLPLLSLKPQQPSRYQLRSSEHAHYLCTSEVAALCLALAGDFRAAEMLDAYLDVFTDHYLKARKQAPVDADDAVHRRLRGLAETPRARATRSGSGEGRWLVTGA